MADDVPVTAGAGTSIATDDIAGRHFQRIKLVHGADGVNAGDVSTANGLPVVQVSNSLVSTANSTAVNLAAAAVFTGTSEDVSEYSDVAVSVFASHASATDGLSVQQSADGTNWDIADVYTIPATTGKIFHLGVSAKFYRLVYTNGATLTTALRIQTLYSKATKRGSSVRPSDGRGNDNDLEEVSAFLVGYDSATTQHNRLRSTIANGLAVDVTRQPTLTKGTQGATGVSTQDLKDAGRVIFSVSTVIAGITAVTAEAMLTMVPQRDGTPAATATTHPVTASKRLRLIGMNVGLISTAAAVLSARISLRMASGPVLISAPILTTVVIPSGAAVIQAGGSMFIPLPDGIELSGTMQFGVSQVCNAATGTVWCSLVGFEY